MSSYRHLPFLNCDTWLPLHLFLISEPRTEIVGKKELYVDYASSLNITCLIKSPNPPAYVFWKKEGKVSLRVKHVHCTTLV